MRFAICNELFKGWEIERVFEKAREVGYEGVEIAPFTLARSVTEIPPERRRGIREAAGRVGIEVVGLHWLLVSPEGLYINHPDDSLRERTREYFLELIEFCADLGGKVMVCGSPKQRNVLEGQSFADTFKRTVEVMRRCAERAGRLGVTLCFEPLPPAETNFINTAEQAITLVEAVDHPSFQLILDVKAMCSESKPIPQIIESSAKYLRHVHANDSNLRGPGFGAVDFAPIFRALRKIGYRGFVSVEVFDFSPDPDTIATRSFAYLEKTLREVDNG